MPEDLHEWVSFEDPDEDRTWVFDLTYLTSPWKCIFGEGCQGVLTGPAEDLQQGCCSYGAHFVDEDDELTTLAYAARLTREQWQHKEVARRKGGPTKRSKEGEIKTRLVDGACIFLNRVGFAGGIGCALHRGALEAGERPLDWKPDVCWQLPLRLDEHTDDDGHVTSTLREWKRRDWGVGGFEFHWWCTDDPQAFVDHRRVYESNRDEIVELVGPVAYALLVEYLVARGTGQLLPHPALRRR
ncbi:MAG: hypothetical protein Q8K58_09015 [Acidimicrobiales bacterium]|nr:hypothetical protein [Acidimicrobiales bacterium]